MIANNSIRAARVLQRHFGRQLQLGSVLAQPPPDCHGAVPLRSPRRQHVRRHLRRGARHGAEDVPRAAAPGGVARVHLKRRLFELSLSVLMEGIAQTKTTRPEADADTDMSVEAQEYKHVLDELNPLLGAANRWDYLPALRWFDVFGVQRKILAAVNRRNAFIRRLIDAERQRLDDDDDSRSHGEKRSMISLLLTLQKTDPDVYTDSVITKLCAQTTCLVSYLQYIISETFRLHPTHRRLPHLERNHAARRRGCDSQGPGGLGGAGEVQSGQRGSRMASPMGCSCCHLGWGGGTAEVSRGDIGIVNGWVGARNTDPMLRGQLFGTYYQ
uniref:Cytochrome P450 n=1 Tax=Oryza brachyantha TaxID=4533 RepID=J3LT17_ORYBR